MREGDADERPCKHLRWCEGCGLDSGFERPVCGRCSITSAGHAAFGFAAVSLPRRRAPARLHVLIRAPGSQADGEVCQSRSASNCAPTQPRRQRLICRGRCWATSWHCSWSLKAPHWHRFRSAWMGAASSLSGLSLLQADLSRRRCWCFNFRRLNEAVC